VSCKKHGCGVAKVIINLIGYEPRVTFNVFVLEMMTLLGSKM
jgi:hypothetical protein